MCFKLEIGRVCEGKPKPQIAEKNITVYKVIEKSNWGAYRDLRIKRSREKWQRGFHYYETTPFKDAIVQEGDSIGIAWHTLVINGHCFHSHLKKDSAEDMRLRHWWLPEERKVVKMIIPKGAKYYDNGTHIVSSDIIFPRK